MIILIVLITLVFFSMSIFPLVPPQNSTEELDQMGIFTAKQEGAS
ncbi:MAG TPA: hypothetical protein VFF78_07135 [Anaerolineaceae bacterium]|nr:hypothetical protein [Anaerolineaceae bacterium]